MFLYLIFGLLYLLVEAKRYELESRELKEQGDSDAILEKVKEAERDKQMAPTAFAALKGSVNKPRRS